MPSDDTAPRPTDAEMEILAVLWERGPSTVRDVYDALSLQRDLAYTTVLKFLQIMTEKGLVTRDDSRRTHVYAPASAEQATQQRVLKDLLHRVFGGSREKLLLQALAATDATPAELRELQKLVDAARSKAIASDKPASRKGSRP